jgi:hypothetical protein
MTSLSRPKTTLSVDQSGNIIYFNDLRSENVGTARVMKEPSVLSPKELSVRWFILVVFSVFALLVSSRSDAQDVYNFYFQKNAPVPTTTTTALPTATPVDAPVENKIEAAKPVPPQNESEQLRRWELMLSYAGGSFSAEERTTDSSDLGEPDTGTQQSFVNGEGSGLITAYRFNKFVSAEGAFSYLKTKNSQADLEKAYHNFGLGLMVTPLHINMFGYELIEFGVGGGLASTYKFDTTYDYANRKTKVDKEKHVFAPYAGIRIAVNFVPQLALVVDSKKILGSGQGGVLGQIGLRYRF